MGYGRFLKYNLNLTCHYPPPGFAHVAPNQNDRYNRDTINGDQN